MRGEEGDSQIIDTVGDRGKGWGDAAAYVGENGRVVASGCGFAAAHDGEGFRVQASESHADVAVEKGVFQR